MTEPETNRSVLKGMTLAELEQWVIDALDEKPYRARQLYRWMYVRWANDFEEMTDLSKAFRQSLSRVASAETLALDEVQAAEDGTKKLVFRVLRTNRTIEAVYIPSDSRVTLCISSQMGCALGCKFCLTATLGLKGNLTSGEIVDQVVWARRLFEAEQHISNIVFMGMGEPLNNYENVVQAARLLTDDKGLNFSHRKVTISTAGLIPEIRRLGDEDFDVGLAISLNATTNKVRDEIMPINKKHDLHALLKALRAFPMPKRRRITIEYVLLDGVNDSDDDARRLVKLLRGLPCKINLIPFNPHEGADYRRPTRDRVLTFQSVLLAGNYNCLIREARGDDKMAACGQLGAKSYQTEQL